jgi:lysozyme
MKYIRGYGVEDSVVQLIIENIDVSINESSDVAVIWDSTLKKIKDLSTYSKRKVLSYALSAMISVGTLASVVHLVNNTDLDTETTEIVSDIIDSKTIFQNGYEFSISDNGIEHIKDEEKLRTQAYKLGDGKITIGYGHAEPVNKSKFKIGDVITEEEAEKLLKDDLMIAEDGVKRIFKEWESKGIDVPINQDMYDAMVSIAFNTGVGGLRTSEMIKHLKKGDYENAGNLIKSLRLKDSFPGLMKRRDKESKMFLSSLGINENIIKKFSKFHSHYMI